MVFSANRAGTCKKKKIIIQTQTLSTLQELNQNGSKPKCKTQNSQEINTGENLDDHGYDHDLRSNTKGMIMKEITGMLDFI